MPTSFRVLLYRRVQEALRKMGTIFIGVAPLVADLRRAEKPGRLILALVAVGLLLITLAVAMEWKLAGSGDQ